MRAALAAAEEWDYLMPPDVKPGAVYEVKLPNAPAGLSMTVTIPGAPPPEAGGAP